MFVKLTLSDEDCHCTAPLLPFRLIVVVLLPEQTDADPLAVPADDGELTVTVVV